jgi:hypothetical protein
MPCPIVNATRLNCIVFLAVMLIVLVSNNGTCIVAR